MKSNNSWFKKNFVLGVTAYPTLRGIGVIGDATNPETKLAEILSRIIGFMTIAGVIYFIFQVIIAGYNWISAAGDSGKVEQAQQKLMNSIMGIFIVFIAVAFVSLLSYLLGADVDLLNIGVIIGSLVPR